MKLAVVGKAGKGGAGKTSISGTLARLLARRGHRVLAVDGDPNPALALSLGIPPAQMEGTGGLTSELVERTEEGYRLTRTLGEVCASHSLDAPRRRDAAGDEAGTTGGDRVTRRSPRCGS